MSEQLIIIIKIIIPTKTKPVPTAKSEQLIIIFKNKNLDEIKGGFGYQAETPNNNNNKKKIIIIAF